MTEEKMLIKYNQFLQKLVTESTILGLSKIPNICDRYMERLIKFFSITVEYSIEKEKDPKKCVRNVKKLESSPEYIDLLENCLVPKIKHIDKIFKKYPKTGKKLIVMAKKMISILEKKIEKMDKNNEKKMDASLVLISLNGMKEKIKNLTTENERFESFLKKNKNALEDLKKKDVRQYITFYTIRYPLGCFVLP
jgi:hypothetical protein